MRHEQTKSNCVQLGKDTRDIACDKVALPVARQINFEHWGKDSEDQEFKSGFPRNIAPDGVLLGGF